MKTRLITGIVLGLVFVPLFYIGGVVLELALVVVTVVATFELFTLYNTKEQLPYYMAGLYMVLSGGLFVLIAEYYSNPVFNIEWIFVGMFAVLVIGSLLLVFVEEFQSNRIGELLFAVLYPSIGFGAIFGLRSYGFDVIGFLFLITIATDIFAYIVGINFGKHRLAIKISPKKSVEGSIGGTAFAIVFTLGYVWALDVGMIGSITLSVGVTIGLVLLLSVIGQIGDLVASKLKRHMGIKDFSNIFPGHGGVMDRFDSVILAAIVLMLISKVVELL